MIYIFGHKKPDTDSVTSAIALSYLKNQLGSVSQPRVLGEINEETKFVLDYFNVKKPEYLDDVKLQIKDIKYYKECYLDGKTSILNTYKYMQQKNVTGVPLIDQDKKFRGLITTKMIGNEIIGGDFTRLYTSYNNIKDVLEAEEILKFDEEISGKVIAAAFRSTTFLENNIIDNNTIMIVGDRHSLIEAAVNAPVKLLIIVGNKEIKEEHLSIARNNKVNVIRTSKDTYTTAKLINLANYIETLLTDVRNVSFQEDDFYTEFKDKCLKLGYNNYPILDKNGYCKGLIRITDINEKNRKQVILVDHNEATQSVDGLEEAEILEIVDHHKIGNITTVMPINFRNMTVGSTNTIIYSMFKESNVDIPKDIAGLMLSGILSDTLKFTSPTTTEYDKYVGVRLAHKAGINIDTYSKEMFKAAGNLKNKTCEEIISTDLKIFEENNKRIAVSQVTLLDASEIVEKEQEYIQSINNIKENREYDMLVLCVTDILKNGSYIYSDTDSLDIIRKAFDNNEINEGFFMDGIVSRKKQLVPKIVRMFR